MYGTADPAVIEMASWQQQLKSLDGIDDAIGTFLTVNL